MDQFIYFKFVLFKLKNRYRHPKPSAPRMQGEAAALDLLTEALLRRAVPGRAAAAPRQSRDAAPAPAPRSLRVGRPCCVLKSISVLQFILNAIQN